MIEGLKDMGLKYEGLNESRWKEVEPVKMNCKILNFIRRPKKETSALISQFEKFLSGGSILFITPFTCSFGSNKPLVQLFN